MTETPVIEARSHVKLWLTAKGDLQVEVKIVAGTTKAQVDKMRQQAVETFEAIRSGKGTEAKIEAPQEPKEEGWPEVNEPPPSSQVGANDPWPENQY